MDEFLQQITKQLGLNMTDGQSETGNLQNLIQSHLNPALIAQISAKLPGISGSGFMMLRGDLFCRLKY